MNRTIPVIIKLALFCVCLLSRASVHSAQEHPSAYVLETIELPDDLRMEVSGMASLPDGRMAVAIRRGEIWIMENAGEAGLSGAGEFRPELWKLVSGLHEPLGLSFHEGWLYTAQRSEFTRVQVPGPGIDGGSSQSSGGGVRVGTAGTGWGLSGNYHEYAYGPVFDHDGRAWVTLNTTIGRGLDNPGARWSGWRGWALSYRIHPGLPSIEFSAAAHGLRSPSGIGVTREGDVLATDQQGNWIPTCSLLHLNQGGTPWFGHRDSIYSIPGPDSPLHDVIPDDLDSTRVGFEAVYSGQGGASGITIPEAMLRIPGYRPPAVWFPYRTMGMSATGMAQDQTAGDFGPFDGQLFVGEFTMSMILRVQLERIRGRLQGTCFRFVDGLNSAAFRLEFGRDGTLFVGQTNRGWNSLGNRAYGIQTVRLDPARGQQVSEVHSIRATPRGFRVRFTDVLQSIPEPGDIPINAYTYWLHAAYGSDKVGEFIPVITGVKPVVEDGAGVGISAASAIDLEVSPLTRGYVYEFDFSRISLAGNRAITNPVGCYTLNVIP